jgi:hypothetical protein
MFQSPNIKFDKTDPTPAWESYLNSHTEMLFNKTETNEPVVHTIQTDPALLQRCTYVLHAILFGNWIMKSSFLDFGGVYINPSDNNFSA